MTNRRMGNADGMVVDGAPGANPEGAGARVRILNPQLAELAVLPGEGCFAAYVTIDRHAAGALLVELFRLWAADGALARLHAAEQAVEWARNSGSGQPTLTQIDELTEAVRQVVPSPEGVLDV